MSPSATGRPTRSRRAPTRHARSTARSTSAWVMSGVTSACASTPRSVRVLASATDSAAGITLSPVPCSRKTGADGGGRPPARAQDHRRARSRAAAGSVQGARRHVAFT